VWLLLPLLGAALLVWALNRLVTTNTTWVSSVSIPAASTLDGQLFDHLLTAGILQLRRDSRHVEIARTPCTSYTLENPAEARLPNGQSAHDYARAIAKANPPDNGGDDPLEEVKRLILEFCDTDVGERIRDAIDLFNTSRDLLAVRDNRAHDAFDGGRIPCTNTVPTSALFVPPNCLTSQWSIQVDGSGQDIRRVSTGSLSVEEYYILSADQPQLMSDWAVARPFRQAAGESTLHRVSSTITFGARPVLIDVVGFVTGMTVDGVPVDLSAIGSTQRGEATVNLGGSWGIVRYKRLCQAEHRDVNLCVNADRAETSALRFTLDAPRGSNHEVALLVYPSGYLPPEVRERRAETAADPSKELIWPAYSRKIRNIRVTCPALELSASVAVLEGAQTSCAAPEWIDDETPANADGDSGEDSGEKTPFALTIDNVAILDASGNLTPKAFGLGYGDILGFGTQDLGSYADYLSIRQISPEFTLTVHPRMQQRLKALVENNLPGGRGPRTRVDLVVLDAEGDGAGELLGYASWPSSGYGLSHWDLRALSQASPALSPFAGHVWTAHDGSHTPGSTFKLVTSLAAIQYLMDRNDPEMADILLGRVKAQDMIDRLGLSQAKPWDTGPCEPVDRYQGPAYANAFVVYDRFGRNTPVHCIGNYNKRNSSSDLANHPWCQSVGGLETFDMCSALIDSSNLFFAGLAMEIDKRHIYIGDTGVETMEALDGLAMHAMAERLSSSRVADAQDLTPYDALDPAFPVSRVSRSPMSMTVTSLPQAEDDSKKRARALDLAQAGMGQAVSATPIAMAAVAASIATERVVVPRVTPVTLSPPAPDIPLIAGADEDPVLYRQLYDQLVRGMNGTVNLGTGTAALSSGLGFLKPHLFAKTGTANLSPGLSLWRVGDVRPPGGDSGSTRTVAFACRVANVGAGGGGGGCGPLVNELLRDLHDRGL
jgi:hypothetical protein